jgi:hypothetical protein
MVLALLGAAAAAATDWGYRSLIASQGIPNLPNGYWNRVDFVTLFIAGIGAAALGGALLLGLRRDGAASLLLAAALTGSAALGLLAIFSIGLALFVVAALLALAMAGSSSARGWRWLAAHLVPLAVSVGILVAGISLTGGW